MQETKLADYIFSRLSQYGVLSVFGVPGDFNLTLLDAVPRSGLHWVGNCNELNAAYAADAYARVKGLSALVTTYGVGELSAINGVAGACAERVPLVHIVGTPSRAQQRNHALLHHTFADGEFRRFAEMHRHVTVAQCRLESAPRAVEQLEWVLEQAITRSRPVYIEVPTDMVDVLVSVPSADVKGTLSRQINGAPKSNHSREASVARRIVEKAQAAKQPCLLVDGHCRDAKYRVILRDLITLTNWPTWTTCFGKGLVDEQLHNVHGVYMGRFADENSKTYFEQSDLCLHFGPHISTTNSFGLTAVPKRSVTTSFDETAVQISDQVCDDLDVLETLALILDGLRGAALAKVSLAPSHAQASLTPEYDEPITQKHFWGRANELFREGDIILTETGTAAYGGRTFVLPTGTSFFTAVTWLSIGYMLPAALGASLAERDLIRKTTHSRTKGKRTLLFIGDGSLQMTAQEISTMIKEELDIIIFVINNDGYTIERAIHGYKQAYNDIARWNYGQTLGLFGLDPEAAKSQTFYARTWKELDEVLTSEQICSGHGVRLVEVCTDREDCEGGLAELLREQIAAENVIADKQ